jgi:branched-chain amino acid transport system substrate-binding protein
MTRRAFLFPVRARIPRMHLTRIVSVVALALLAGCQQKEAPSQPAAPATPPAGAAPAASEIVIGHVSVLAGDQATFGESSNNGVKLAIEEANAKGGVAGRKLALVVYDTAGKPEEAATAATRLITADKATVLLGELASSRTLAIAPIADTHQVPLVTAASTSPKVTKDGDRTRPFVFRVCFIDPFQGTVMAKFVRNDLKLGRAAILRDVASDYSVGLADYFAKTFKELGGEIVADVSFKSGDQDFKAQLTSVRAKKPDILYVPAYYTDVALIGRQVRELGMKVPLAGGDGWDSAKLYEIAQGALDGSYFTNHYTADSPLPAVKEFIARYEQKYAAKPDAFAALGYDAARVAIDAIGRAADPSPRAVRDAIEKTKGFAGVTGTITLDADHNPVKSAVVLGIDKNAPKYVTTVEP